MTIAEMEQLFDDHQNEYLKTPPGEEDLLYRSDLAAFILLETLAPGEQDVLAASEHDEVWLSFDPEVVAATITEEQVIKLIRWGVRWDEDNQTFGMFV